MSSSMATDGGFVTRMADLRVVFCPFASLPSRRPTSCWTSISVGQKEKRQKSSSIADIETDHWLSCCLCIQRRASTPRFILFCVPLAAVCSAWPSASTSHADDWRRKKRERERTRVERSALHIQDAFARRTLDRWFVGDQRVPRRAKTQGSVVRIKRLGVGGGGGEGAGFRRCQPIKRNQNDRPWGAGQGGLKSIRHTHTNAHAHCTHTHAHTQSMVRRREKQCTCVFQQKKTVGQTPTTCET